MAELKLHLDADTSRISLWRALLDRGHDVTREGLFYQRKEKCLNY